VDVHKQSVTAVAVDEAGRMLGERTVPVGSEELIGWAAALDAERLWALEDCRLLTPWLERQLLGRGEELVRVSPKLTVPERRAGRTRGKSDPIDALAVARAALREPDLPRPQPGERVHREIKLLVDHRDDLVDERRRTQQRLRWHLHELDRLWSSRCADSTVPASLSVSAAGWHAASRKSRCGSRASLSPAAAR
jgi:transposase